jgi:hypothetical protein
VLPFTPGRTYARKAGSVTRPRGTR